MMMHDASFIASRIQEEGLLDSVKFVWLYAACKWKGIAVVDAL